MDELLIFGGIVLLFVPVVGAVLGILAFVKVRRLGAEREQREAERQWLVQQVTWLQETVLHLQSELAARPAVPAEPAGEPTQTEPVIATQPEPVQPVAEPAAPAAAAPIEEPIEPIDVAASAPVSTEPAAAEPSPEPEWQPAAEAEPQPEWAAYTAPAPAATAPRRSIAWEQFLGIRGAAILGGIVLALAALLFVRYAIESGWLTPALRIAMGAATGFACLGLAFRLRAKDYDVTANALSGAGIVALYASVWAAHTLYDFVSTTLAFGLMILVTVLCAALAWLHQSQVTAALGLVGGFLTPLLINSGQDRPIGLFGYLLLLNVGMLALGQTRRWPWLTPAGLLFTLFYETAWLGWEMHSGTAWIGLVAVGLFGLLFLGASTRGTNAKSPGGILSQIGATLTPFGLAMYFASRTDLNIGLVPLGLMLSVLAIATCVLAKQSTFRALPAGAAGGALAVLSVWAFTHPVGGVDGWLVPGFAVLLAGIFAVFATQDEDGVVTGLPAALLAELGFLLAITLVAARSSVDSFWPWLAGFALLTALAYRTASLPGAGWARLAAGALSAFGLAVYIVAQAEEEAFPGTLVVAACAIVFAGALWAVARFVLAAPQQSSAYRGAHAFALIFSVGLLPYSGGWLFSTAELLLLGIAIAGFGFLSAGGLGFAALTLVWAIGHGIHGTHLTFSGATAADQSMAFALMAAFAAAVTFWPLIVSRRLLGDRFSHAAAAMAPLLWFIPLVQLFDKIVAADINGVIPALLALLAYLALQYARGLDWPTPEHRRHCLIWFAVACVLLAALAIPVQFENEWITIGWALQGLALLILWLRVDHPGLKYAGLALLAFVSIRLLANPEVFYYHDTGGWPIVNWLLYTYLVPAAALIASAYVLHRVEAPRARPAERWLYGSGRAWGAIACAAAGILVTFWWANLSIDHAYSAGAELSISFDRMPARDLTRSVAWAAFAVCLLVAGIRRSSSALRWASLAGLVLTIAKVFLYDLGELEDLYRVASLVGLAISLLGVSVVYQKFVFARPSAEEEIPAGS